MIIRRLEALFTIKSDLKAFKHAASEVDKLAGFVEKSMTAIASLWGLHALHGALTDIAADMSNIATTAGYLGIPTDALQELRYAADKSGISIDTLDDSLKELQIRAVDATTGSGEAFDAFNKLGVKTTDFAGRIRKPLELLEEVADKLLLLPTQSERIWMLDSMLGDQGAEMLKMLKNGSVGFRTMRQESQLLNHVVDEKSLNKALAFNKSMKNIKNAFKSIANTMATSLMPTLNFFMGLSSGVLNSINKIENRVSFLRTTIISLGLALSVLAFKVLIAFGPMIFKRKLSWC